MINIMVYVYRCKAEFVFLIILIPWFYYQVPATTEQLKIVFRSEYFEANIKDILLLLKLLLLRMYFMHRLDTRLVKGSGQPKLCYRLQQSSPEEQTRFYTPTGVYFMKTVKGQCHYGNHVQKYIKAKR